CKVDLLKNISPPLGVIPKTHLFSIKIPPPLGVVLPKCIPYAVMLRNETSRNIAYLKKQINLDYFGVQFLHLRCRMTDRIVENRTDSFLEEYTAQKNSLKPII